MVAANIQMIPNEILDMIFEYLHCNNLYQVSLVSRRFFNVSQPILSKRLNNPSIGLAMNDRSFMHYLIEGKKWSQQDIDRKIIELGCVATLRYEIQKMLKLPIGNGVDQLQEQTIRQHKNQIRYMVGMFNHLLDNDPNASLTPNIVRSLQTFIVEVEKYYTDGWILNFIAPFHLHVKLIPIFFETITLSPVFDYGYIVLKLIKSSNIGLSAIQILIQRCHQMKYPLRLCAAEVNNVFQAKQEKLGLSNTDILTMQNSILNLLELV